MPLHNMIGFTADNCPVMMGRINGAQAKLRELIPKLPKNWFKKDQLKLMSLFETKITISATAQPQKLNFQNSKSRSVLNCM